MELMLTILEVVLVVLGLWLASSMLLPLWKSTHWYIRNFEFVRLQLAVLGLAILAAYAGLFNDWSWFDNLFMAVLTLFIVLQLYRTWPYLVVSRKQVKKARPQESEGVLRLVISNVLQQNNEYARWLSVIRAEEPDLILALEINQEWLDHVGILDEEYPYSIKQPQDNMYGMALWSRKRLLAGEVKFVVQETIPSIQTWVEVCPAGKIFFYGVHPRPPQPFEQHATPRDAEMVVLAREIRESDTPMIIAGDLNDVAWSHTTNVFMRLSRMLDPRRGRGLYNSYNARSRWLRVPLDHIFHTYHFFVVRLERLGDVGSDHFPILAELSYEPNRFKNEAPPSRRYRDILEAESKIRQQKHAQEDGNEDGRL